MAKTTFSGPVQSLGGFLDAKGDAVGSDAGGLEFDRSYYDERFIKKIDDNPSFGSMENPLYSQAFGKENPPVSGIPAYTQGSIAQTNEPFQGATFQFDPNLDTSQALSLTPFTDDPSGSGFGATRWGGTFNESAQATCKWKIISPYTYASASGDLDVVKKSAFYAGLKGTNSLTVASTAPGGEAEAYFFFAGENSNVGRFNGSAIPDPTKLHFIYTDNDFAYGSQLPITVEKKTAYDLEVKFDSDGKPSAFVNGVQYNLNNENNGQIISVTKGTGKGISLPGDSTMRPVAGFSVDSMTDLALYTYNMSVISVSASVKADYTKGATS